VPLLSWCRAVAPVIVLAASLALAGVGMSPATPPAAAAEPGAVATLTAVGDIDGCHEGEDTAELVAKTTGPVATIGDYAYPEGTADAIDRCYDPTWGPLKGRTRPVPGNHDYDVSKATPYYQYFGAAAGEPGKGWYSYEVGSWHVVALNSNCDAVDCDQQSEWLDSDLSAHPSACILAYWHHPRFTSGTSGGDSAVGAFWKVLYNHGATVVLNGHDHDYERFAPQDPSGHRDPERGIREFVVGTGGAQLGGLAGTAPNSEVRNNRAYGVLELTLRPDGYDWRFVPTDKDSFTDAGSDTCRGSAPAPSAPPPSEAPPPAPSEPEPSAAPVEEPDAPDPGPSAPAPSDPPVTGRRPRVTSPTAPPRATRPERAAGSGSPVAKPASSGAVAPPAAPSTVPPTTPTEPTPVASDPGADAQTAVEPDSAEADSGSLALAISGLIEPSAPPPSPTDRRGLTLVAIALMAADCVAIGAIRRRRPGFFSG
jgi:calcineurin-like phosphoesterase family protein